MAAIEPVVHLDTRFSSEGASPTEWREARERLREAEIFWLSTVREDRRPHVTPLIAVFLDDALYFCTGPTEQKAKNLEHNRNCILTTGSNSIDEGLDLVVEGEAVRISDDDKLQAIADAYVAKYGEVWRFGVRDDAFVHGAPEEDSIALVFEVAPRKAFAFRKGGEFSQTRWRFPRD
jgi:nitroimidazol reductase NimA-like FMN-containing flavoprotein (pyridoxamine 5'-phosphate oxidase superfamily)